MKKSKKRLLIVCLSLLIATCIVGVSAYMFRQSAVMNSQFEAAVVDCEVVENKTDNLINSIKVKNTGNIDSYIRLKIISYWSDANGRVMPKASEMPVIEITDEWFLENDDIYYCKYAVSSEELSSELLKSDITFKTSEEGYIQVIEIFAEAIQSVPADAVEQSWNVSIDGNGMLSLTE